MEINELKIELLKRVLGCNDMELLMKIKKLLVGDNSSLAEDALGEYYLQDGHVHLEVPESFYDNLEDDYKKFLNGELKGKSWEEIKRGLELKDGI